MKKTIFIRFLKILALALPVFLFVLFSQQYLFYYTNHNAERIRRFYQEEKNSIDVAFLGASDVFTGFAPALAYEEYGFTSYMYAVDSNPGELYRYQLEEVLKRQTPQYIFVEINGFLYDQPVNEHKLSIFADNIPMSLNRLKAIWRFKGEDKLSNIFPFVVHHGDWVDGNHLQEQLAWRISTSRSPSLLKGMVTSTEIDRQLPEDIELSEERKATMRVNKRVLDDFLNYCKEKNLNNIVFVRFPHKTADKLEVCVEEVEKRVQAHGYSVLNLEEHKENMGLDELQDYYNPEHLNIYGQKKLTTYLGKLIVEMFHLVPVSQSSQNQLHWDSCVDYYHSYYEYAHENIINGIVESPEESNPSFSRFLEWLDKSNRT